MLAKYERVKQVMDRAEEEEDGEPLEAEYRSRPFPPATEAEIRAFEKAHGQPLPPSFRAFLKIHNGWQCFWGAFWITGVSGPAKRRVDARLREAIKDDVLAHAEWSPKENLVLGADDNYGFLVFDGKPSKNGERKVLDCPRGFPENTFASFADLLAVQLACREKEIAKLPKALRAPSPKAKGSRARTFECTTGGSKKFWTVGVHASTATFTWGRIGTDGQTTSKVFANRKAAEKDVAALIAEKVRKGYKEKG